ncbi:serine O-acetyltransferase [Rhodoplanes sp. SY1]|uniref:serine O-acetyltransferase n=1 Tax=Rhodoplanes sp. SY1 TaxID=3166646 RepID=UPI0038B49028
MNELFREVRGDLARYGGGRSGAQIFLSSLLLSLGFQVCLSYRIYSRVQRWAVIGPWFQRIIALATTVWSGAQISATAKIGPGLYLPHPIGIVIANNTIIGVDVDIYQGVTIGRIRGNDPRAAIIGDGVSIYAGAKILGPVSIGDRAEIGANAVVLRNVPADAAAVGVPARVYLKKNRSGPSLVERISGAVE